VLIAHFSSSAKTGRTKAAAIRWLNRKNGLEGCAMQPKVLATIHSGPNVDGRVAMCQ
jgi:hypothetical protein